MATKILFTGDSITDAFRTAICQDVERWVPPEQREEQLNAVLGTGYPQMAAA